MSNGGKELISDATVTLAYGRRYGLIGHNGAGKSTFLRALAAGDIKGLPPNCQVRPWRRWRGERRRLGVLQSSAVSPL